MSGQSHRVFGLLQYRLFAYSTSFLVQVKTLLTRENSQAEKEMKDVVAKDKHYYANALNTTFTNALSTFTLLVKQNPKAVRVLHKIFSKFLFDKANPTDVGIQNWGQADWYNFFIVVRNEKTEGPKNFWNN